MHINTRVARFEAAPGDRCRPTSTPIYQTATFEQDSALGFGEYDYSRSGNPTRTVLETQLAELEGGRFGFAFSSGMTALSTLLRATLDLRNQNSPATLIVGADLYGGTTRLIESLVSSLGVDVQVVDTTDLAQVALALESIANRHGLVLLETPSNPLLRVTDIAEVARLAHAAGIALVVDNTALSPYLQNPLELGADVVVHSATKHLAGHGDLMAGALITNSDEISKAVGFLQNAEGTALAPFDSWLLLRGIKTLAVRLSYECQSALAVAEFLADSGSVTHVHYPGLSTHAGHSLQAQQARGFGQLISFETGDVTLSRRLCEETKLFTIAVSFGSANSTISLPCHMSHASVPTEALVSGRVSSLPPDLVRISIGLEDSRDLIADLESVLSPSSRMRSYSLP